MTILQFSPIAAEARREPQRPQAIIFDWDNTLIDSWYAILDAQNHTLTAFGLEPWTLEETRERVQRIARRNGVKTSQAIRKAIAAWIAREEAVAPVTAYETIADLTGCVRGGRPDRSVKTGRQLASLLKQRREPR